MALPVNYEYSDGRIVITTDVAKAAVLESQQSVGFEVERIDEFMSEGWSVLVTGPARRVDAPRRSFPSHRWTWRAGLGAPVTPWSTISPKRNRSRNCAPVVSVE